PAECPACGGSTEDHWCTRCGRGWIGNIALDDRDRFDEASEEFDRLRKSVEIGRRCATCGPASYSRMRCPDCGTDWSSESTTRGAPVVEEPGPPR
ncbi:MAG: hypothetical protein KDC38_11360, partial [Planctomycetes bacterium]|nr:hypothetical protein [Planctomycetota bacterium]